MTIVDANLRRVGMLTHHALDHLWMCSRDALPNDPDQRGCCPVCCAPCVVLAELAAEGDLDEWVRAWPDALDGTAWWDGANNRVDRDWLTRAWAQADSQGCHSQGKVGP